MAKVSCMLCHWGVQLILAYSWARPAILVAGSVRGRMFLFLLFLHFHSSSSFFPVPLFDLFYLFCLFSPFLWGWRQHKMIHGVDVLLNPNTINQSMIQIQILNGKQCRSRSVGFFRRSQLIWIYTVCKGRTYPGSAGQGLTRIQTNKILSLIWAIIVCICDKNLFS